MRRILFAAALLIPSIAHAERKSGGLPPADPVHDFHTTDRFTPVTTFGFALGYQAIDDNALFLDSAIGMELAGHFVSQMGGGGYLVVPFSHVSVDPPVFDGDSELMIGNVEAGFLYAAPLGHRADVLFHLGVALPTAADEELIHAYQPFATTPRYGDLVQRWPNSTWMRLGVSPMGTAGPVFYRADLGLDLMLDDDDDTGVDISPVVRVNVAGGLDFGKGEVSVELATNIVSPEDDTEDETASTLAVGGRFDGGNVHPGIALIFPIDFDGDADAIDFGVAASLTVRVP